MNEILNKYYEEKLVYKQEHPTLPLTIWNYSEKVQYDNLWDDITIQTRGLVTDDEGNIVARPFKKFFNLDEKKHTPTEKFDVYEKMDGSLGILFNYKGEWIMSTRGSFISEQSIKGREILNKYQYENLLGDVTYLFEIIYPENRIVVDYGQEEKLILIGAIHTQTGDEYDIHSEGFEDMGFEVVKRYPKITNYTVLKEFIPDSKEGYVIRFTNGDRVKIKGEEYLRLHKLMTNVSTTAVWEMLSEGRDVLELLKGVPDEFFKKIKMYVLDLRYSYLSYSEYAGKMHDKFRYGKFNDRYPEPTKKEFAEFLELNDIDPKVRALCFAIWDNKNYDKMIWKYIKPEFRRL